MRFQGITCGLSFFMGILTCHASDINSIKVTVKTAIPSVAALGYQTGNTKSGSMGAVHKGQGPKNQEYMFGYRRDWVFGKDISCGSKPLKKDSIVTLVQEGGHCAVVVSE